MAKQRDPIRILTAVPICDGHDSAINTINLELIKNGIEVIYLGYHRSVRSIVRAAIQEDVRAVGISSYNGGHVEFFSSIVKSLRKEGAGDISVFGGGGGTITADDDKQMRKAGVDKIFFAGTPLKEMIDYIKTQYGKSFAGVAKEKAISSDRSIAKILTAGKSPAKNGKHAPPVIGFTGPGGAGKTTLIDEFVRRYLQQNPKHRVAILSHDPSIIGHGALLGDRATMIYSQDDRVFMRSLATRGAAGGLAPETEKSLKILRNCPFDLVIVETVGIGQEALPFDDRIIGKKVLVMSPSYGARLQLQKIAMLDDADFVVVNKNDLAGAKTAVNEMQQRIRKSPRGATLISTVAKNHGDPGVLSLLNKVFSSKK